ncbi:MAG: flagellar basal body P-ring protein FlgI [Fibrobacterales bacterium]
MKGIKGLLVGLCCVSALHAARIKDVAQINGLEATQLVGYGLVVGLDGTGDGSRSSFTIKSVVNMLRNLGVEVPDETLRLRNVAAVMVTSELEPFMKRGLKIDVTLSSMGDARSLEGGTLLMTPLQGPNRNVYALAQGAVSVGGLSVRDSKNRRRLARNHVLAARISGGAIIKVEPPVANLNKSALQWSLSAPDFSSAVAMTAALNRTFNGAAKTIDAATVEISVPKNFRDNVMGFIAQAENVTFSISAKAKVILNEKTGTIVAGANVQISTIAVSHANININIRATEQVSQPNALTQGKTTSIIQEKTQLQEDKYEMKVLDAVSNVGELATALNSLGVTPRDVIAIFQSIKKAGALHAELVIM